jgi:hypothetical protein
VKNQVTTIYDDNGNVKEQHVTTYDVNGDPKVTYVNAATPGWTGGSNAGITLAIIDRRGDKNQ